MHRFGPGGPTYYGEKNTMTPVLYLTRSVMGIISVALVCLFVFFVVLPIIRKKIHSAITAVNCIMSGAIISLCLASPEWLRGGVTFQSPMSQVAFNKVYDLHLGLHIGLSVANITLRSVDPRIILKMDLDLFPDDRLYADPNSLLSNGSFYYNEVLHLYHPNNLIGVEDEALRRGLPTPILSAINFLASAELGFESSHQIVEAGYHVYLLVTAALVVWIISTLFIAFIPRYSSYGFIVVGTLMLLATLLYFYWANMELFFPCITIEGKFLELRYGLCFWMSLGLGTWEFMYGSFFAVYDILFPDAFLTIFDVDYEHKRTIALAHRLNKQPDEVALALKEENPLAPHEHNLRWGILGKNTEEVNEPKS